MIPANGASGLDAQRVHRFARRWAILIVAVTLASALASYGISQVITPVYQASGTLLVLAAPQQQGQASGVNLSAGQVTSTYAALITARPLIQRVINEVGIAATPQELVKRISATPDRDAEIIQVEGHDTDAKRAAEIVNTLMTDFVADVSDKNQRRIDKAGSAIKQQINQIEQDLSDYQQKLVSAQRSKQDTTALSDHIQAQNAVLTQLTTIYSSFSATQVQNLDNVSQVSSAIVPDSPASPRTAVNTVLGGLLGLILGLAVALAVEFFGQGLRTEEDVRERLGTTLLGLIPVYSSSRVWGPRSRRHHEHVAEAYRRLRTNLRFAAVDRTIRSVVVTSGRLGEGKSCTCANLACALAAAGQRVLLADADMRRPSQHRLFEKPLQGGLSEMLVMGVAAMPSLNGQQATEIANLSVLTSGTIPPNPSELLASTRAGQLIEALEGQHDLVIIDTPPTGAVTDALSMAARASATIIVIEAGKTSARHVRHTIESLRAVGANVIGVVLNKAARRRSSGYYYGYYPYRAERSSAPGAPGAPPPPPSGAEAVPTPWKLMGGGR